MNPRFLALSTVFFWSFGMLFGRIMSQTTGFFLVSLSFLFSALSFLIYSVFCFKRKFIKKLTEMNACDVTAGLFGYLFYWVFLILCFSEYKRAAEPTVLNYTWPVFTIIFSNIYHQAENRYGSIYRNSGIFLCFISVCLIFLGDIHSVKVNISGILYGILAGASYGFFSAYSARITEEQNPVFLFQASFMSFLILFFYTWQQGGFFFPSNTQMCIAVTSGAAVDGIGYMMWTRANYQARIRNISISAVASIMFLLPFFSLFLVAVFLGEKDIFSMRILCALMLIIVGQYFCQKKYSCPECEN